MILSAMGLSSTNAQTTVFDGNGNSDKIPYRIPAIVQTSNEDILVFADKRHDGGDVGQNGSSNSRIDIVYKRYTNGAWGSETTVKQGTNKFGYGDVAVVADRENPNEIVFFTAAGNIFFTDSKNSDGKRLQCYRFRSSDGGATWDTGTDITTNIYNLASYDGVFKTTSKLIIPTTLKSLISTDLENVSLVIKISSSS